MKLLFSGWYLGIFNSFFKAFFKAFSRFVGQITSVSQLGSIEMCHPVCRKALNESFFKVSSNCFLQIEYFLIMANENPEFNIITTKKISSGNRSLEYPWTNMALVRHTQCVPHTRRSHHFTTVVSILSFPTSLSGSMEETESQDAI